MVCLLLIKGMRWEPPRNIAQNENSNPSGGKDWALPENPFHKSSRRIMILLLGLLGGVIKTS